MEPALKGPEAKMDFNIAQEPWTFIVRILVAAALGGVLGLERNYETEMTTARMSLRVFHRGDADKLSHLTIEKLEQSHLPLKSIKWFRS
jgi:hypothetical protein